MFTLDCKTEIDTIYTFINLGPEGFYMSIIRPEPCEQPAAGCGLLKHQLKLTYNVHATTLAPS